MLGVVAIRQEDAGAARRGYSGPIFAGFQIVVTDGARPGTIQTQVFPASPLAAGRALFFSNLSGREIEVEVVPPESAATIQQLAPNWSLRMPIDHAGRVLWRVWLSGNEPGEYEVIDFQE